MGVNRSEIEMKDKLDDIFNQIDSSSLFFFTDIMRIGYLPKAATRDQQLADYYNLILKATGGRTLIFPTFNYDYCRTGVYNVLEDRCQVGALNEYIRKSNPHSRTLTPVFNFSIINNNDFQTDCTENVFSQQSVYGQVVSNKGAIVLFGRFLPALGHHLEEIMKVSYRYQKKFRGKIINNQVETDVELDYRVRPLTDDVLSFDNEKIYNDLISNDFLKQYPLGNSFVYTYQSDKVFEYWSDRMQADEHYLLTSESQKTALKLYTKYGQPLSCSAVEV